LLRDGANVMVQFVAFLKGVRPAEATKYAVAFLKTFLKIRGEYAFAYLKTMDRSEAIGFAAVAVAIVLLMIALT
jgi:hypothetical protein